jgi:hypothetical protein
MSIILNLIKEHPENGEPIVWTIFSTGTFWVKRLTGVVEVRSQLLEIVCLSDTHELHRDAEVPDGDLLVHSGDITFFSRRRSVLTDFNDWLGELPHL